nr:MAG TPA: holin protein [Bacteriophage sp.]
MWSHCAGGLTGLPDLSTAVAGILTARNQVGRLTCTKASRNCPKNCNFLRGCGMEILQIVLTAATGSGVTAIILAILQRKWTKDDKRDAIVDALKVLLIDRVRYLGQKYISDGSVSLSDRETLDEMHQAYKSLGGNGHLKIIMSEVGELPIRKE